MGERPEGMTLDRIDGSKGYEMGATAGGQRMLSRRATGQAVHAW